MRRLTFDDPTRDGAWNDDGARLGGEIRKAIDPIIQRYCDEGYSRVDVENIVYGTMMMSVITPFTLRSLNYKINEEGKDHG